MFLVFIRAAMRFSLKQGFSDDTPNTDARPLQATQTHVARKHALPQDKGPCKASMYNNVTQSYYCIAGLYSIRHPFLLSPVVIAVRIRVFSIHTAYHLQSAPLPYAPFANASIRCVDLSAFTRTDSSRWISFTPVSSTCARFRRPFMAIHGQ